MKSSTLTRREAAEISGVPLKAIDKAVEQGVIKPRRSKASPLLAPEDIGLIVWLRQVSLPLPAKHKRELHNWLVHHPQAGVGQELELSQALRVTLTEQVIDAIRRALDYAELRDKYIERNPKVMGGEPVIRGTRVPVRSLARQIELGEGVEVLREDYPHVPEEAFEVAHLWAQANPRRGRPPAPWRRGEEGAEQQGRGGRTRRRARQRA